MTTPPRIYRLLSPPPPPAHRLVGSRPCCCGRRRRPAAAAVHKRNDQFDEAMVHDDNDDVSKSPRPPGDDNGGGGGVVVRRGGSQDEDGDEVEGGKGSGGEGAVADGNQEESATATTTTTTAAAGAGVGLGGNANSSNSGGSISRKLTATEIAIIDMMKKQNLRAQRQSSSGAGNAGATLTDPPHHAFWDTQPMPHGRRENHPEGPIEPNKRPEDIRQQPYAMPSGFEWSLVNIEEEGDRTELYNLLAQNYVEDDDALFRFDYSPEFLVWALTPPGYDRNFIFGVRSKATSKGGGDVGAGGAGAGGRKLVAFISGVPATLRVNDNTIKVVEINFLCVHKKLRSKRLAPVLIKEMTRRVNLAGMFQAVYTAGTVLPVPVATARYHHRSLNPKKLVQVGFSRLSGKMTLGRLLKLYKLPDEPSIPGLRPMTKDDVPGVHQLLESYMTKFALKIVFSEDDVAHWLLPRDRVVHAYVVDQRGNQTRGKKSPDDDDNDDDEPIITDLISFYHLPSSILKHNDTLYSVYSYYNVATSVPIVDLMKDALILAKRNNYDVFNALNLMDNDEFLEPLKFGLGDGFLQYYIYNWACPELPPSQVGIVLL